MVMRSLVALAVCLLAALPLAATPLHSAYDLQGPGLSLAYAGTGLQKLGAGARNLTLTYRGRVELALLYWAGRDRPCPLDPDTGTCADPEEPYKDQVLTFDGVHITGELIGSEAQPDANPGAIHNIAYMADVTELVRAKGGIGRRIFQIADGDRASNLADLDGAGLLVVYEAAGKPAARVVVSHGLDFAYGEDRTAGDSQITQPIAMNHGAARAARKGELLIFAGDALRTAPDRIDIHGNEPLVDKLDGSAGAQWDADLFPVTIPGGAVATAVQVASEPVGKNPDSLLWVMAALRVPLPDFNGCTADLWNNRPTAWQPTGIKPTQRLRDVFSESGRLGIGNSTLREGLRLHGGAGLAGATLELLREGTAALLNAAHPALEYPRTRTQVITAVDSALRTQDPVAILELAEELGDANRESCPLR